MTYLRKFANSGVTANATIYQPGKFEIVKILYAYLFLNNAEAASDSTSIRRTDSEGNSAIEYIAVSGSANEYAAADVTGLATVTAIKWSAYPIITYPDLITLYAPTVSGNSCSYVVEAIISQQGYVK